MRICIIFAQNWGYTDIAPGIFNFPDNSSTRSELKDTIYSENYKARTTVPRILFNKVTGDRVKFQVKEQNDAFYYLFINEKLGLYPIYSRGTYIIKRDIFDGSFIQVKVFIKDDPGCFVRIFPDEERVLMDIFLYDNPVNRGIAIPLSLDDIIIGSFYELIKLTENSVDWEFLFPEPFFPGYRVIEDMINKIREKLPDLKDADDGAMNKSGEFVKISDLSILAEGGFNCSGFAKWIADGLYFSKTGEYMDISRLKEKHMDSRGHDWSSRFENERDPYFGLDWTRNIAGILADLNLSHEYAEGTDVRKIPFMNYIEDVGYPISSLEMILYNLAVAEPGSFYLGSINREFGTEPILRQHTHVAVLFPYITHIGEFKIVIMERNRENTLEAFIAEHPGEYIHLVGIETTPDYSLPDLINPVSIRR